MLPIPRHYAHLLFGALQSGLTTCLASGVSSIAFLAEGRFLANWLQSWAVSWLLILPVVLVAAPVIRDLSQRLTR
jgi:hypothetical protein